MSDDSTTEVTADTAETTTETVDAMPELTPEQLQKVLGGQRFKTKIDGRDVDVDLAELQRGYGHNQAANKRLQAASNMEKQSREVTDAVAAAKTGDLEAFAKIFGHDEAIALSEQLLMGQIDFNKLPEGEQRARKLEKENERLRAESEERQRERDEQEAEGAKGQALADIDKEFADAFKNSGRKPTKRLLRRMAEDKIAYIRSQKDTEDYRDLPADRILNKVFTELETEFRDYTADADAETLVRALGPNGVKTLQRHFAEAARSQDPLRSGRSQPSGKQRRKSKPRKGFKDAWDEKENRYG